MCEKNLRKTKKGKGELVGCMGSRGGPRKNIRSQAKKLKKRWKWGLDEGGMGGGVRIDW